MKWVRSGACQFQCFLAAQVGDPVLKFLQRASKAAVGGGSDDSEPARPSEVGDTTIAPAQAIALERETKPEPESAAEGDGDLPAMMGREQASKAIAAVADARRGTVFFLASPRTRTHFANVEHLLTKAVASEKPTPAVALVTDFKHHNRLSVLRLSQADASALSSGVADAVAMLAVTMPAAFASDSYAVARVALDEELRSGHDTAMDALKERAAGQNIGLLRTPLGYGVAPLHEGRVVALDVLQALPSGLKADVDAKLDAFEAELGSVLEKRTLLQHDHARRLRGLERDTASLAVTAALSDTVKTFCGQPTIAAYLKDLSDDLTDNARLLVVSSKDAGGRAPIDIARDPALARYRVHVLDGSSGVTRVSRHDVSTSAVAGTTFIIGAPRALFPATVEPGVLTRAGGGFCLVDARDVLSEPGVWTAMLAALQAGVVHPFDADRSTERVRSVALPVDCRLAVCGDLDDYRALCALDEHFSAEAVLVRAFEPTVVRSAATERAFKSCVEEIIRERGLRPLDDDAMTALLTCRSEAKGPTLSTNMDVVGDILARANRTAMAAGRDTVSPLDIAAADKARAQRLDWTVS